MDQYYTTKKQEQLVPKNKLRSKEFRFYPSHRTIVNNKTKLTKKERNKLRKLINKDN